MWKSNIKVFKSNIFVIIIILIQGQIKGRTFINWLGNIKIVGF